ncbi:MAG: molybdopterin adenylyltransferase, partial [Chloroflexi bacterium]|nr:molybdopterin adenylyltransferase [Chloroflexota bacterium]
MQAKIGILTVSDRAHRGIYEDRGGPAIRAYMDDVLTNPWRPVALVVPDELEQIKRALLQLVDDEG